MLRRLSDMAVCHLSRRVLVVGDSGKGVSSTRLAFTSFPSIGFHLSPERQLALAVGLAPVEGLASVEGDWRLC